MALSVATVVALGLQCAPAVDSETLVKQINRESGRNPFAVGTNDGWVMPRQPQNLADAIATATKLQRRGIRFDAGLAQLSSANIARLKLTWEQVFDPCTSLREGQRLLVSDFHRARAIYGNDKAAVVAAFSSYNTGDFRRGVNNGYVASITPRTASHVKSKESTQ